MIHGHKFNNSILKEKQINPLSNESCGNKGEGDNFDGPRRHKLPRIERSLLDECI